MRIVIDARRPAPEASSMAREPKNFEHLLGGNAKGLTDAQLRAHFTLYQGYVKKLNEIRDKLAKVDRGAPNYSFNEYSELKRREPVAFNGTVLHELYFENLGNDGAADLVVRYGGAGKDAGHSLRVDAAGAAVMSGLFSATVDFGGGPLTEVVHGADAGDFFLVKLTF